MNEPTELNEPLSRLVLAASLRAAARAGQPSGLSCAEWLALTRALDPRERVVVALHVIREMGFEQIGAWFGFSRHRADQLWRRALKKMRNDALVLAEVA